MAAVLSQMFLITHRIALFQIWYMFILLSQMHELQAMRFYISCSEFKHIGLCDGNIEISATRIG